MSEKQIIETLGKPYPVTAAGIMPLCDTVLGIPMVMYPLDGLRGSLESELPDTADLTMVAFFRSADYTPDGNVIGDMVVDGKPLESKAQPGREAYVAVSPQGKLAVGAGAGDEVREYVQQCGGSFFKQYLLVGDNTLPPSFRLHGKVQRAALGRTEDGRMYYVMTHGRETMWGFADALREYGFIDAAYVTGGDKYDFMRRPDGTFRLGDKLRAEYAEQRGRRLKAPVLVFRRGGQTENPVGGQ